MQMRGDSEAVSFRGDKGGDRPAAVPQAQPAGAGSAPVTSLPGLGRRGVTNKGLKEVLENKSSQSPEPQMQESGPN